MVNRIKDKNNKELGKEALNKANKKEDDENNTDKAKKSLKEAINNASKRKKDDNVDTIVDKITKDKDASFINKATEVIKKAEEFLTKTQVDARKDYSSLETYVNGRSQAKTAVDNALKHENGKGYVTAALE